ncbi:phosphodiester glycosidase family protein [Desulfosporosinus hippei]|uniref:Phosphodiester glycosidase domain-containing protein n=1 Tax=Desulfosporosinus hippei DSM 8344 TaxID=1121419 RepID=A0A1G7YUY6_9FIRM|nr:phosphodiester glycosidase family protein [Desulfosporosinus hippei]SDH00254.1 Predicted protein [Desulfosporosinus hippei DSM 8344]
MTYLKKVLVIFLTTVCAVLTISGTAVAQPKTLYETRVQQTITAGATLEHISRFTADGWLNIKVLRIDTTNPNIKIDTLANSRITDPLSTVLALAQENNAVAAVNASFFNPMGGGTGYPDGPFVQGGDLVATSGWYNQNNDEMASLSLDNAGQILFNYWENSLTLTGFNNVSFAVTQYNQPSRQQYMDITVLDNKWGPTTLGASETYPDLVEILVSQGRVIEIRQAMPAATIPAQGYVVISRGEQALKLLESLRMGDPAQFTVTSNPDWSDLQMSATGSSLLVKDGQIPETFSYSTGSFDKKNPRTLAGSSEDGKQLILVTIDGRQDNSIGLTQSESAQLMEELGAYNALIFDGGGSTTMVARKPGTSTLDLVNIPSEGSLRSVANGIGIFSQASSGSLTKLILETEDPNVFVHTSRKYTLRGVDSFANPVKINPQQIKWRVSGIKGRFRDNQFQPTSVGKGKIIAKVGELTAELDIRSLSAPVKLKLSSDKLDLPLGQSQTIQVTGYDQQGFQGKIQPKDVQWAVSGKIGDLKEGIFKATAVGAGYIKAGVGGVNAYIAAAIYENSTDTIDSFDDDQPSQVIEQREIPQNTSPKDDANRRTDFKSGSESFKFSVFASRHASYNTMEEQLLNKMTGYINENLDMAVYTGSQAPTAVRDMSKPALISKNEYKTYDYKNSSFIQLDVSQGGLRRSDPEQWLWLFEELDNLTGSNVFVVMSAAPATFINAKESELLKDTLAEYREKTGKNLWVLFSGDVNQCELDRGVRYISCAGFSTQDFSPEKPTAAKYLEVTVMENDITYEFKDLLGEGITQ